MYPIRLASNAYLTLSEFFYILFFAGLLGARGLGLLAEPYLNQTFWAGVLLFALKVVSTEHTRREYLLIAAFLILGTCIALSSGSRGMLLYFMLMLGAKNVNVRRVIYSGALSLGLAMVVVTFLFTPNFSDGYRKGVWTYGVGYFNPNASQFTYLMLMLMVLCLQEGQSIRHILLVEAILLGIGCYLYLYNDGRSAHYVAFLYCILLLWITISPRPWIISTLSAWGAYLLSLGFMVAAILINDETQTLNTFRNRLTIGSYIWHHYSVNLFGQALDSPTHECEIAQLNLLMGSGILAFIVVNIILVYYIHTCLKKKRYVELSVQSALLLMGTMEPFLFNYSFRNFTFVFVGRALYEWLAREDTQAYCLIPGNLRKKADSQITRLGKSLSFVCKQFRPTTRRLLYLTLFFLLSFTGLLLYRRTTHPVMSQKELISPCFWYAFGFTGVAWIGSSLIPAHRKDDQEEGAK